MVINHQNKYKLIVISLIFSFFAISAGLYFLNDIAVRVRQSKIKIAEINRDISLLDKIVQEKSQYENDIQRVKSTLPTEYYEVSFFTTQLERLAQNNNLTLEINIDQNKKDEKETYDSVAYSLELRGTYQPVSEYFSQISKLAYHTTIDHMEILNEEGILTAKVKLRLFLEK